MKFDYVFWGALTLENVAHLDQVQNVPKDYEISEGIPRAAGFPPDAFACMSDNFPTNTLLADTLANIDTFVLVSRRQRDFIELRGAPGVEFLEIRVQNHKRREIDERYHIVHPVGLVELLDRDASRARVDSFGNIERIEDFVVLPANIPDKPIFRVAGIPTYIAIHRDFAAALDKQGFTGNRWAEPSKLVGIELPPGVESLPYW